MGEFGFYVISLVYGLGAISNHTAFIGSSQFAAVL
jgi:hypothetical protein